ncbi:hypothetical protein [Nonomuraea sp. NPDC050643]|uniref:hypothetical protein n=1 Tax=Nonomuraea sp. NPDC050643 TaxID=3155660 RepID=UPI0033F3D2DA
MGGRDLDVSLFARREEGRPNYREQSNIRRSPGGQDPATASDQRRRERNGYEPVVDEREQQPLTSIAQHRPNVDLHEQPAP